MKIATQKSIESTKKILTYIDEIRGLLREIKSDLSRKSLYKTQTNERVIYESPIV